MRAYPKPDRHTKALTTLTAEDEATIRRLQAQRVAEAQGEIAHQWQDAKQQRAATQQAKQLATIREKMQSAINNMDHAGES